MRRGGGNPESEWAARGGIGATMTHASSSPSRSPPTAFILCSHRVRRSYLKNVLANLSTSGGMVALNIAVNLCFGTSPFATPSRSLASCSYAAASSSAFICPPIASKILVI